MNKVLKRIILEEIRNVLNEEYTGSNQLPQYAQRFYANRSRRIQVPWDPKPVKTENISLPPQTIEKIKNGDPLAVADYFVSQMKSWNVNEDELNLMWDGANTLLGEILEYFSMAGDSLKNIYKLSPQDKEQLADLIASKNRNFKLTPEGEQKYKKLNTEYEKEKISIQKILPEAQNLQKRGYLLAKQFYDRLQKTPNLSFKNTNDEIRMIIGQIKQAAKTGCVGTTGSSIYSGTDFGLACRSVSGNDFTFSPDGRSI